MSRNNNLQKIIKEILSSREPLCIGEDQGPRRHACVLVPLLEEEGIHKILLTKRTDTLAHHKGQISFPGGSCDECDCTLEDTALREAFEEIGLHKDHVRILGRIDDAVTVSSSFVIHPIVGQVPCPYEFTLNAAEVERLIKIPLDVFRPGSPACLSHQLRRDGWTYSGLAWQYEEDIIWGATARVISNFMEIFSDTLVLLSDER